MSTMRCNPFLPLSVSQVTGLAWAEFMLVKQIFATVEKERERTRVEWAGRARRDTEPAK